MMCYPRDCSVCASGRITLPSLVCCLGGEATAYKVAASVLRFRRLGVPWLAIGSFSLTSFHTEVPYFSVNVPFEVPVVLICSLLDCATGPPAERVAPRLNISFGTGVRSFGVGLLEVVCPSFRGDGVSSNI